MTVLNSTIAVVNYKITAGTISQSDWDFLFEVQSEDDLLVILDGTDKTLNSDYTVVVNGTNGGTVTFVPAVVATFVDGMIINIIRNISYTRATSYQDAGKFSPSTVDLDMDRLTLQAGQSSAQVASYGMRFPVDYPFVSIEGYNILPKVWDNFQVLSVVNGVLTAVDQTNDDPALRGDLAVDSGSPQGSELVGYEGTTVKGALDTNTTNIGTNTTNIGTNTDDISALSVDTGVTQGADLIGFEGTTVRDALNNTDNTLRTDLAIDTGGSQGSDLVGYEGTTVKGALDTNTTNIGTNATNIGTNATNIGTNATDISNILDLLPTHRLAFKDPSNANPTITTSLNISSVVRTNVGRYTITLSVPLLNTNFPNITYGGTAVQIGLQVISTTVLDIETYTTSGVFQDSIFSMVIFK